MTPERTDQTPRPVDSFTGFVVARSAALMRTAFVLSANVHDAEDLLQATLLKAARQWRRIEHHPEPYVRQIMYHENVSRWRAQQRRPAERLVDEVPDTVDSQGTDRDIAITLERALAGLTPKQRTVLVLRFYEDLSERQTAEAMGTRLGTVKSATRDALARLRQIAPELADLADAMA